MWDKLIKWLEVERNWLNVTISIMPGDQYARGALQSISNLEQWIADRQHDGATLDADLWANVRRVVIAAILRHGRGRLSDYARGHLSQWQSIANAMREIERES